MRVLIDADGCPVVDIALAVARRMGTEAVLLCDTSHEFQREGVRTVTVSRGPDAVDYALVNLLAPGDVAVTQDYGLAAMCLARGGVPLNQDGMRYTAGNIDALLFQRHNAKKLRRAGVRTPGPKKRRPEQDEAFAAALTALLNAGKKDEKADPEG
jgi:uncharacterized protein YaiI (UPF0178 family)